MLNLQNIDEWPAIMRAQQEEARRALDNLMDVD